MLDVVFLIVVMIPQVYYSSGFIDSYTFSGLFVQIITQELDKYKKGFWTSIYIELQFSIEKN